MNEKILQEKLSSKLPDIQNLFTGEMPIRIVSINNTGLEVQKDGKAIILTNTQIQALQVYLNIITTLDIDGLQKENPS